MRSTQSSPNSESSQPSAPGGGALKPLTRNEFYSLAQECYQRACELALYDQNRVDMAQCRRFNDWLPLLTAYERLGPSLAGVRRARPITRWHVVGAGVLLWLGLMMYFPESGRNGNPFLLFGGSMSLLLIYFIPEHLYGTTVGLLEGRLLRVVDALDEILQRGEMGFTQAAFFQTRDNLARARRELRQQLDLAYRNR